jgi:mono/diheme cytochrome c family protein
MPYQRFAWMTRDDAESIGLYIKSLPPKSHAVPEDTAHPTQAATAFDYTSIPHTTLAATDPAFASAERGRYMSILGCLQCHTPSGSGVGGLDVSKSFAGGRSFGGGVKSANLTPDATGLAGWSIADLVATLKTDKEKGTGVMLLAPMPGGPDGLGGLTDPDLNDIAEYIHTLAPVVNGPFGRPDM